MYGSPINLHLLHSANEVTSLRRYFILAIYYSSLVEKGTITATLLDHVCEFTYVLRYQDFHG